MKTRRICLIGGTGFVGCHLTTRLVKEGYAVRLLTRRREAHRDLLVLPGIELLETDVYDPARLAGHFADVDAVVNLAGILNEDRKGGRRFEEVHVALPRRIVAACQAAGVRRLLHMSALKADAENAPSRYLRSKGEGEQVALGAAGLDVTAFRPSVIFGPGDPFFNRFARLLALTPGIFLLACPQARFAPVYVGDVVEAFVRAIANPATYGQAYELCGPGAYTLHQLVEYVASLSGRRRLILPLGPRLSWLLGAAMEWLPGKPFSRDNYRSTLCNSLCKSRFPALFGITPTAVEAEVPGYLGPRERNLRLSRYRRDAHRTG